MVLGAVALAGLRPWATTIGGSDLSPSPGIGAALGDATAVARAGSPGAGTAGLPLPVSGAEVPRRSVVSAPKQRASDSGSALAVSAGSCRCRLHARPGFRAACA